MPRQRDMVVPMDPVIAVAKGHVLPVDVLVGEMFALCSCYANELNEITLFYGIVAHQVYRINPCRNVRAVYQSD